MNKKDKDTKKPELGGENKGILEEKEGESGQKEEDPVSAELAELQKKADALEAELQKQKDILLRTAAEYDNYRKRTAAQASQAYADGKAEAILKLVPVADTFGYALDAAKDEATRAGIATTIKNFTALLSSLGVKEPATTVPDHLDQPSPR